MTITVKVHFVDGGYDDWQESDELVQRYETMRSQCGGKALVRALLTDDWASPPRTVELWRGQQLVARIAYE